MTESRTFIFLRHTVLISIAFERHIRRGKQERASAFKSFSLPKSVESFYLRI